jgi:hypothetical protein
MEKAFINLLPSALVSSLNPNSFRRNDIAVVICMINYVERTKFPSIRKRTNACICFMYGMRGTVILLRW